tara:strand:- start:28788 stop:28958 length:171 start_codon:yes stop_codon:yes gene_type:complete
MGFSYDDVIITKIVVARNETQNALLFQTTVLEISSCQIQSRNFVVLKCPVLFAVRV